MLSRCALSPSRHACWAAAAASTPRLALRTSSTAIPKVPPRKAQIRFTQEQAQEKYDMRIELLKAQREKARIQAQENGDLAASSRIYKQFSDLQKEAQAELAEDLRLAQGPDDAKADAKAKAEYELTAKKLRSRVTYKTVLRALIVLLVLEIGIEVLAPEKYKPRNWFQTLTAFVKTRFREFEIVQRKDISSTASIYTLESNEGTPFWTACKEAQQKGIWHLDIKQPQIQVVRAYTPLPNIEPNERALRFLIRHEKRGEVSSWLKRLPLGTNLELRGPFVEYEIPEDTDRIVFLAGGTGIASALQAAHSLLARDKLPSAGNRSSKKISILWACRRREDCASCPDLTNSSDSVALSAPHLNKVAAVLTHLQAKYPNQLEINYYIDEEKTFISKQILQNAIMPDVSTPQSPSASSPSAQSSSWFSFLKANPADQQPPQHQPSQTSSPPPSQSPAQSQKTQILISGPEGFIAALAGPKVWTPAGEEQGALGGILERMRRELPELDRRVNGGAVAVWKV